MSSELQIVDTASWHRVDWQDSEEKKRSFAFLTPIRERGTLSWIKNIDTELMAIHLGSHVLPLTINEKNYANAYVCSPYTHYVSYAKEELRELRSPLLEKGLHLTLSALGGFLQVGAINRVVMVNNWFVSTNLYPDLSLEQLSGLTQLLCQRFPDHAIVFRSVTDQHPEHLYDRLRSIGYLPVPSRQVYYFDPQNMEKRNRKQRKTIRREKRLLVKNGYQVCTSNSWTEQELQLFIQFYHQLYLDKYSDHNPQFTVDLLRLAIENGFLQMRAIKKEGQIDGVFGYFVRNGAMAVPFLGYRMELPKKVGLYRILSSLILQEAEQKGLLLHRSSGVGAFKRNRGAVANIEYNLVYTKHLPPVQRVTWQLLSQLMSRVAVPLIAQKGL